MLRVSELQEILSQTPALTLPSVKVAIEEAHNYRLAEPIYATINVPPSNNSAMDGYAFKLADMLTSDGKLAISARITAGEKPPTLVPMTCARIFTGAQIPAGADTVEMQENVGITGEKEAIFHLKNITKGANIRPAGQDIANGEMIANKGTKLTPALIGLLASIGMPEVKALRPLRIFMVSTGDEIEEPGAPLAEGKIFNSNRYSIAALLQAWGKVDIQYSHVKDSLEQTCKALELAAKQSDVVISFGGVSVGEEDHIKSAVAQLGSITQWKVKLKPGKPIMLGQIQNTPILGLPGNPASAYVSFLLFAKPLLNALCSSKAIPPKEFSLPLAFDVSQPKQRPEYVRSTIENGLVIQAGNQSSGALTSLAKCEGLAIIEDNRTYLRGDTVTFIPIENLIYG